VAEMSRWIGVCSMYFVEVRMRRFSFKYLVFLLLSVFWTHNSFAVGWVSVPKFDFVSSSGDYLGRLSCSSMPGELERKIRSANLIKKENGEVRVLEVTFQGKSIKLSFQKGVWDVGVIRFDFEENGCSFQR
jgi:hypothetical protein